MINICTCFFNRRWWGKVGIAHALRTGWYDFRIPPVARNRSLPQNVQTDSRAHPGSRHQASFSGVKRPGLEVNHSPSSNDEAKNEWIYTSTYPIRFHGVDGKNFTFLLPALISKISTFCQHCVFALRMILTVNCYFCQTGIRR
jgi:hypothetical protein